MYFCICSEYIHANCFAVHAFGTSPCGYVRCIAYVRVDGQRLVQQHLHGHSQTSPKKGHHIFTSRRATKGE